MKLDSPQNNTEKFFYSHNYYESIKERAFSMHSHNCYEIILFIRGNATHVIEDRKYKLSKNDLVIIKPFTYHFIQIDGNKPYERFDLLVNADALGIKNAESIVNNLEIINISSAPILLELFNKIDYYQKTLPQREFEEVTVLLIKELFINLSACKEQTKKFSTLSPILSQALNYIAENLFSIKGISEISKQLYVTESYLFRLFKKELKTSPKKYISDKRLLAAQNMISTGKLPTEIFEKCGFNDYTAFYRSYLKFFGHAPSKERANKNVTIK